MIKLIIFDWDDVFTLGANQAYITCYHNAVRGVGVTLDPEEERRRIFEKWSEPHAEKLAKLLKEKPELIADAISIYEENLFGGTYAQALGFVKGANELLQRLHQAYTLAIATGAHPNLLKDSVMPNFSVSQEVFMNIISVYELEEPSQAKPSPYMAEKLIAEADVSASETIVVGDSKSDMEMGIAAGATPVAVLTGNMNQEDAETLGVKHIIPDVTHLEPVLTKLNQWYACISGRSRIWQTRGSRHGTWRPERSAGLFHLYRNG